MLRSIVGASFALLATTASTASPFTDTNPLSFSVRADSDYPRCCGVYTGVVEVLSAGYGDYRSRGYGEFNLSDHAAYAGESVYFSFTFLGGYSGNQSNFSIPILLRAYAGDNVASITDFYTPTLAAVGTFVPVQGPFYAPTPVPIGTTISFDVTSIFQSALQSGVPALGFQFAMGASDLGTQQGASFGNLTLTSVPAVTPVPEPSEYALMLAGLAAVSYATSRRRRHSKT